MTQQLSGTIQYVNDPQPGRNKGSIKLDGDVYVSLWPNQLADFRGKEGQYVTIPVEPREHQGRTYYSYAPPRANFAPAAGAAAEPARAAAGAKTSATLAVLEMRSTIAAACIQMGFDPETADHWWSWVRGRVEEQPAPAAAAADPAPAAAPAPDPDPGPPPRQAGEEEIPF